MATRKPPKKPTTKPKARKGAKAKPGEPKAPAKQEKPRPATTPEPRTPPPPPKKPTGSDSKRTQAITDDINARLSKGEPLAVICRTEGYPHPDTVRNWMLADPALAQSIARAREAGEESIAADCLLIADDATGDYRMGEKSILVDTDHIQRAKLRIDTRLKLLAKWNPKKWGDKLDVDANVSTTITRKVFRKDGGADGQQ